MPTELKQCLQAIKYFHSLEPKEIDQIMSFFREVHYKKGDRIHHQGYNGLGLHLIIKGRVRILVRLPSDSESEVAQLGQNTSFGEVAFIEGGPNTASVIAMEDTCCYLLPKEYLFVLRVVAPETAHKIIRVLTDAIFQRVRAINNEIAGVLDDINKSQPEVKHIDDAEDEHDIKLTSPQDLDPHFLTQLVDFKDYSLPEIQQLLKYMKLFQASRGCEICEEGEIGNACYFLIQGAVQITLEKQGKITKLGILGPGESFGVISLIYENVPRTATFTIRESAILLTMDQANLQQLHDDNTELWYKFYYYSCRCIVANLRIGYKQLIRLRSEFSHVVDLTLENTFQITGA